MLVLGVDPGTAATGYGFVYESDGRLRAPAFGVIATPKDSPLSERLLMLHTRLLELIAAHDPDAVAVEQLFFNRNVRTALSVGEARGVILLAAAASGKTVKEYTPPQVKQAVTGYGGADKRQMQEMIRMILGLRERPRPDDVADALAVAVCCVHSRGLEGRLAASLPGPGKAG
ncbi:MAG: crossover junction endodeoxyribonuclease RuvC [Bacillota bacterium]|nr:MAG: crossover junction endodeoxyribonuclease RuvC [Bacillota bacterium]